MKVLIVKTEHVLPTDVFYDTYGEIMKQVNNGVLFLDGRYTYEYVEIDHVMVKKPKVLGKVIETAQTTDGLTIKVRPEIDFEEMSKKCKYNNISKFFAFCHHKENFGISCNRTSCPRLKEEKK